MLAGERRADARRKYTSLGFGELTSAFIFGFIGLYLTGETPGLAPALWFALVPLLVILVQAGAYWLLARGWVGRRSMPKAVAVIYRLFRIIDPILLAAGLIGVIAWFPSDFAAGITVAAWLFGVVEYVNYFVVRLAYPLHSWTSLVGQWRTPRLVRDLRASAAASAKSN